MRAFIIIEFARITKGAKSVAISRVSSLNSSFVVSLDYPAMATLFKPSRQRKLAMRDRAEKPRQAKISSVASSSDDRERESSNVSEHSRSSVDLDESLQLPGPTEKREPSDFDGSGTEDCDGDSEVTTGSLREELQGVYDDWIFSPDREDRKMMAMMLYDNYM